jgi:hypothetical protein
MDCLAVIWTVHDSKWQVTVLTSAPGGGVSGTNSMNGPHKHTVLYSIYEERQHILPSTLSKPTTRKNVELIDT